MHLFVLALAAATSPHFIYIRYPAVIALTASANSASPGTPIVLTATVTGAGPTGVVLFTDGGRDLGMVSLERDGRAVLPLQGLHPGDHVITALYNGDPYNTMAEASLTLYILRPRPSPHWPLR